MVFKKRRGSGYVLIIALMILISLYSSLLISSLNSGTNRMHIYSLQMKAYYLNNTAQEAAYAALIADSNDYLDSVVSYMMEGQYKEEKFEHYDGTKYLGTSSIKLTKEKYDYYGELKYWAVLRVTTEIPDERAYRKGESFDYEGSLMVLLDDPSVRIFNINPNSFNT